MQVNKNIVGLAVAVVGLTLAAQVPGVLAQGGENNRSEQSPISEAAVAISEARAIEIAQGELPGTVRKAHLDMERGTATWKVRIISADGFQRGSFRIDANTGALLKSIIKPIGIKHADRGDKFEKKGRHLGERNRWFESRR
ncbi:MAG: PepSY domain-containing protein [Candidatus Moranbacteria bacterium]|nr:PepSY domain-containing protein [Candidatus Moranbacteria bacterium]